MAQKRLCTDSRYNKYDTNHDGILDDDEIDNAQEMLEMELREEKADAHRRYGLGCYDLYDRVYHSIVLARSIRKPCISIGRSIRIVLYRTGRGGRCVYGCHCLDEQRTFNFSE